jgi:hypothetical protein
MLTDGCQARYIHPTAGGFNGLKASYGCLEPLFVGYLPPEAVQTGHDKGHHNSGIIDKRAPSRKVMCQKKSPLRALITMLGLNNLPELIRFHFLNASVLHWIRRSQIESAACSAKSPECSIDEKYEMPWGRANYNSLNLIILYCILLTSAGCF